MENIKQASGVKCFVCGVENPFGLKIAFYQVNPAEVQAEFTPGEQFQGYPGILHGGISAAVLDETAGRVFMGDYPPRFMVTAKLSVKYRQAVPVGESLKLVGKVSKDLGRIAEGWSGIFNSEGQLLAEATVLLVEKENLSKPEELEALGWKVYPD